MALEEDKDRSRRPATLGWRNASSHWSKGSGLFDALSPCKVNTNYRLGYPSFRRPDLAHLAALVLPFAKIRRDPRVFRALPKAAWHVCGPPLLAVWV